MQMDRESWEKYGTAQGGIRLMMVLRRGRQLQPSLGDVSGNMYIRASSSNIGLRSLVHNNRDENFSIYQMRPSVLMSGWRSARECVKIELDSGELTRRFFFRR
jgi:hypothetical protein